MKARVKRKLRKQPTVRVRKQGQKVVMQEKGGTRHGLHHGETKNY